MLISPQRLTLWSLSMLNNKNANFTSDKTMPKRALEGRSTKRRRPAKVPRPNELGIQAEPVSDEPAPRRNKE